MVAAGISHSVDCLSPRAFTFAGAMLTVAMNGIDTEILRTQGSLPPLNTYDSLLTSSSLYGDGIIPSLDSQNF